MEPSNESSNRHERWLLVGVLLLGVLAYLPGTLNDLPFVVQVEEVHFFGRHAARIAATGDLHPGWLGHPASTVIYPVSAVYRTWFAAAHQGSLLGSNARLLTQFKEHVGAFLLLGRLVSAVYGVGALWLTYRLSDRLFGRRVALLATALLVPVPALLVLSQLLRNDSATVFFTALALLAIVRVVERPTLRRQVWAGLACGLAISTKYYLGILAITLLLADGMVLWRARGERPEQQRLLAGVLAGLASVALGFGLSTPYFVLDFPAAWRDLQGEMRPTHLGADGLSPLANLWWYASVALPSVWGWGRYLLTLVGASWVAWRGSVSKRLLLAFAAMFLVGISGSPLHWDRWIFPTLPVFAIGAAAAIDQSVRWVRQDRDLSPRTGGYLAALVGLVVCLVPLAQTVQLQVQQVRPSTMVQTRRWLDEHISADTIIAREEYSFPTDGAPWQVVGGFALGQAPIEHYIEQGATLLIVSSGIYDRFYAEPDRYPAQISFYEELDARGVKVYKAMPDLWTGGPTIKVYYVGPETLQITLPYSQAQSTYHCSSQR